LQTSRKGKGGANVYFSVNMTVETDFTAVIMIVFGLFLTFTGYRLLKATIFICGFALLFQVSLTLLIKYEPHKGYINRDLVLLLAPLACGLVGGFLAYSLFRFGIFLVGAFGGWALAALILGFRSGDLITKDIWQFLFFICFAAIGGFLALNYEDSILKIVTAVGGSYTVFVGIDIFAKTGFSSFAHKFISKESISTYKDSSYGMLCGFIALACAGWFSQNNLIKNHKRKLRLGSIY
jgi:hypothetical protein